MWPSRTLRALMPIGMPGLSDFFAYEVRAGERYAVSFSATGAVPEGLRFESDGVFAVGDVAAETTIAGALDYVTHGVRWIAVEGPAQPVLAVLGDSIGAGQSASRVEERFFEKAQRSVGFPIVDASVGGDGIDRALHRIERDVLALPGVTDCLVQVGTNDLHREDPGFLINGLSEAYARLRQAGIRPWAATIIPKGPGHLTAEAEQMRQTVNEFVRSRAQVQGVVDFDAAVRDPANPSLPLPGMLADGIHPTSAGHSAMADVLARSLRAMPKP
jgi:lysophospholipase L1-like esterase